MNISFEIGELKKRVYRLETIVKTIATRNASRDMAIATLNNQTASLTSYTDTIEERVDTLEKDVADLKVLLQVVTPEPEPVYYTITPTAGANGSISPAEATQVLSGGDLQFTITASEGYIIEDVLVDEVSIGTWDSYSFTNVTENHTISVTFVEETVSYEEVPNFSITDGRSGVTYNYKHYTGVAWDDYAGEGLGATVYISHAHDITFNNCIFDGCLAAGVGDYAGYYVGNTVQIYVHSYTERLVTNIVFNNCIFRSSPRMGVEINEREGTYGWHGIEFHNCTFEPCGSETLSMDGNDDCGDVEVDTCVFGGGGYNFPDGYPSYPWTQNFEINTCGGTGNAFNIHNSIFCASQWDNWNLRGVGASTDCNWTFTDNTIDCTLEYTDSVASGAGCPVYGDFPAGSGISQSGDTSAIYGSNINSGTWTGNTVTNDAGWAITYLDTCASMDLSDTTWLGTNNSVHGESGCSGISY